MSVSTLTLAAGHVVTAAEATRMAEAAQPWATYTATVTNVTVSSKTTRYHRHGDHITVQFALTLSAAPTGVVSISLPVTASSALTLDITAARGTASGFDVSAGFAYLGGIYLPSSTTASIFASGSGGWAAAVPVSWVSGDRWGGSFTFEAA